jgi:hypothetical protein
MRRCHNFISEWSQTVSLFLFVDVTCALHLVATKKSMYQVSHRWWSVSSIDYWNSDNVQASFHKRHLILVKPFAANIIYIYTFLKRLQRKCICFLLRSEISFSRGLRLNLSQRDTQ